MENMEFPSKLEEKIKFVLETNVHVTDWKANERKILEFKIAMFVIDNPEKFEQTIESITVLSNEEFYTMIKVLVSSYTAVKQMNEIENKESTEFKSKLTGFDWFEEYSVKLDDQIRKTFEEVVKHIIETNKMSGWKTLNGKYSADVIFKK